jgi:hypothetical protein
MKVLPREEEVLANNTKEKLGQIFMWTLKVPFWVGKKPPNFF